MTTNTDSTWNGNTVTADYEPFSEVVVFDYGSGNVRSVMHALARAGAQASLSSDLQRLRSAAGVIVPGVGAYASVMGLLRASGGDELIRERVAAGKPTLGICVGLQVLFQSGVEHGVEAAGLGIFPGSVELLAAPIVPHMGWSPIQVGQGSRLLAGLADQRFYFLHSYAAAPFASAQPLGELTGAAAGALAEVTPIQTLAEHGQPFIAALEAGPLAATQFHPEKSGAAGVQLLRNWMRQD